MSTTALSMDQLAKLIAMQTAQMASSPPSATATDKPKPSPESNPKSNIPVSDVSKIAKTRKLPKSNMTKKVMDELNDTKPDGGMTDKEYVIKRCNKLKRSALMMMLKDGFGSDAKGNSNKDELADALASKIPMKVDEMEETLAHMPPAVIDNTLNEFGVQIKASWNKTHKGQRLAQQFYAASDYGSEDEDEQQDEKKDE